MRERCNLCESEEFELFKNELRERDGKFQVFRCLGCSHMQLLPRPTEEEDRKFYDENRQDKNREKVIDYDMLYANNLFDTTKHVELVRELNKNTGSRILDIGSGYGFFVNELFKCGFRNVTGIEPSCERREFAEKYGSAPVIDYDINTPESEIGRFDLITLFHVLEHLSDPIAFLNKTRRLMEPGGIFVCEVPNADELLLETCEEYYEFYWIRAHLNYFNRKTMESCFEKAGFKNVEIRYRQRYGLDNLCNWLRTGKPQIDKPVFEIAETYKPVESFFREHLESKGRSDAIIAIAGI